MHIMLSKAGKEGCWFPWSAWPLSESGLRLTEVGPVRRFVSLGLVLSKITKTPVSLTLARDRSLSHRPPEGRVISRPLLIKGLEYDHALVLDAERLSATELYVATSYRWDLAAGVRPLLGV